MGNSQPISGLDSFCGQNLASIQKVEVIRYKEVLALPSPSASSHLLAGSIQLVAGAEFESFTFPPDVVKFDEPDKETPNGTIYESALTGILNRNSPSSALGIRRLKDGYYIVRFTDFNGFERILGSPDNPARFQSKAIIDKERPSANEYQFQFFVKERFPAFYLQALVSNCAAVSMSDFATAAWELDVNDNNRLEYIQVEVSSGGLINDYTPISGQLYDDNGLQVGSLQLSLTQLSPRKYEPTAGGPFYIYGNWTFRIENLPISLKTGEDCFFDFVHTESQPFPNQVPVASNVAISGIPEVGETINLDFDYSDNELDPEGNHTTELYRYNSQADADNQTNGTLITATTSHLLTAAEDQKYIRGRVIPLATSGASPGAEVWTDTFGPVETYQSFTFSTDFNPATDGVFDPSIIYNGSGSPKWVFPSGVEHNGANVSTDGIAEGLDGTTQQVVLKIIEPDQVTRLNIEGDQISGILDILLLTHLEDLRVRNNLITNITGFQATQNYSIFYISSNPLSISNLDLQLASFNNCNLLAENLPISTYQISNGNSFANFKWNGSTSLTSANLDGLSFVAPNDSTTISFQGCTSLATIGWPTSAAGTTSKLNINSTLVTNILLNHIEVKLDIQFRSCLLIDTVDLGNQSNQLDQLLADNIHAFAGVIDMGGFSKLPIDLFLQDSDLTSVIFPNDPTTEMEKIRIYDTELNSIVGLANCTSIANRDDFYIDVHNNGMNAAEVNQLLYDIDQVTTAGPINRYVDITNNTAPDTSSGGIDGVAAAASIASKGINVDTD